MSESAQEFEKRKRDHIRLSLDDRNEALGGSGLEKIQLIHEALPELNFDQIQISTETLKLKVATPFLVSSMTAGHADAPVLNRRLAEACAERGWLMGVGSQRRQLFEPEVANEWKVIRKAVPKIRWLGNLGLTQAIVTEVGDVQRLVDSLGAEAMIIHTNPLQECLQSEGTPNFRGGLETLTRLSKTLGVPVILKETGCGFSSRTLARLEETGVAAVDISGFGGTHWGRIEGARSPDTNVQHQAAKAFADWGMSTLDSMLAAIETKRNYEIWASGGIRSGVDAVKVLALGAQMVGVAKPILVAAVESEKALDNVMKQLEFELKTALMCTGLERISDLRQTKVWQWQKP